MKRQDSNRISNQVAPLLKSVATEIVERTLEISKLEFRLERSSESERHFIEASLAIHRRELRHARKELARLGWKRDDKLPLCFLHVDPNGRPDARWQLEDTGFHRSLTSA